MAPDRTLPPYAWREDQGYLHPEEAPPSPPGYYCPGIVLTCPIPGGCYGPPLHHGFSSFTYPGYTFTGPLPGFDPPYPATWPTPQQQGPPSPPVKGHDGTPSKYEVPGVLVPGAALHYQDGKQVCFHVLGSPQTLLAKVLAGDHDGYIDKHIHQFNENSSVEFVMQKLRAGKGGKMTQVHEKGGGVFYKGTTFEQGTDGAKKLLKDFGWGGAGLEATIEPIWVVIEEKKDEKKC